MSIIRSFGLKSGRLTQLTIDRQGRAGIAMTKGRARRARARTLMLIGCILVGNLAILAKLTYLAEQPDDDESAIPPVHIVAKRPDIIDRNGELLATDLRMVSLYAEPNRIVDVDDAVDKLVQVFPDLDRRRTYRKLANARSRFTWLERQITPKQESEILALGIPAVGFRPEVKRFYPEGRTAAHVVGYVDIDNHGKAGMEKYLDGQGLSDLAMTGLTSTDDLRPVKLSIDLRVQNIVHDVVEDALTRYKGKSAGAVVLNVHTGEVVAMVSDPDYDPNDPEASGGDGWLNRMSGGTFEMGSTFKTFSMAMAFDLGAVKATDKFDASAPLHYGRYTIHDDHDVPRRWLTVPEIFRYSSNIGTAKMMDTVGMENQQAYLTRFGLLTKMDTELPEVKMPSQPKVWKKINSITISFGHGVATTPLQTAVAGAAMINGGRLIEPTFLPRTQEQADEIATRVIKPSTSDIMRSLFKLNGQEGSGVPAQVPGFQVGGKTGTANKVIDGVYSHKLSFNAFLGAFPIDHPDYVVLTFIDQPLTGEHGFTFATNTAAPMVREIVGRTAPLLGVEPQFSDNLLMGF